MLRKNAAEFLGRHPPFDAMGDRVLAGLVETLKLVVYPAGTRILSHDSPSPAPLHVVRQGLVRISARTGPGREPVLDFRGVGETFGFFAGGAERGGGVTVEAVSDTSCFVADPGRLDALVREHPELRETLAPPYFPVRSAATPHSLGATDLLRGGSEKALFTTPVRDLASREVVATPAGTSVREAARLMSAHRIGALIVLDGDGRPSGIVTTADLRDRVLAAGLDAAAPVSEVMSAPVLSVEGGAFCYEALLKMLGRNIHHLVVTDAGRVEGVVSSNDFLILQGTSPLIVTREIERQSTIEGLALSAQRVLGLVTLLLSEGASAGSITRVITNVNDRIERRILDITLQALGPPPVPFAWIVYGSAGRKEQTFRTDQDNAIVHRDPAGPEERRAAEDYFSRFAELAVDASLRCGFARCAGNFMATNPGWRQPLAAWKRAFHSWVGLESENAVYNAANLFDFRGLHGDQSLSAGLRDHLTGILHGNSLFLKAMADQAMDFRPPLGLFGGFLLEKAGDHAHTLDLKKSCLIPLVNLVRIYSFEGGVPETSTVERLAALKHSHPTVRRVGDDLAHAFEFLALLRIRHQHERLARNLEPDNLINPKRLSSPEQRALKDACRLLARSLSDLERKYDVSRHAPGPGGA